MQSEGPIAFEVTIKHINNFGHLKLFWSFIWKLRGEQTNTCTKSMIKTLEKNVKYGQS